MANPAKLADATPNLTPPRTSLSHHRDAIDYKWQVLGIVMIGTFMSALDSSILNVSIPAIMADFGSSLDDIEWIMTSYRIAFATLMPLTAWCRGLLGHRVLYVSSLAVFTVGSVLCGIAWNLPLMLVARVIQAIGGGALMPTGMAMISEIFEPRERGRAIGSFSFKKSRFCHLLFTYGSSLYRTFRWRISTSRFFAKL
jgi:MFS family permease